MLNKSNFEIAKLLSTYEDATVVQGCLYVSPGGTSATDGHLLVKVSAPEVQPTLFPEMDGIQSAEWYTPFLIDRDTALKFAKAIPTKGEPETRIVAIDTSTEANGDATMAVNELIRQNIVRSKKIEAEYPDLDKHIPDAESASLTIALNPHLLSDLCAVIAKFAKAQDAIEVVLRAYGPDKSIRLDATGNGQSLVACLMPMRSEASGTL